MKHIKHPRKYLKERAAVQADLIDRCQELLQSLYIASQEHALPPYLGTAEQLELSILLGELETASNQAHMDAHAHPTKGQPVYIWSRDCDQVEGDRVTWIHPEAGEYDELVEREEENAEGPLRIRLITQEQAAEFEPTQRDRALEAYENGRGANAYSV